MKTFRLTLPFFPFGRRGGGGGHPKYLGLQWGPGKKIAYVEGVILYYIQELPIKSHQPPPPPHTKEKEEKEKEIVIPVKYLDKGRGLEWHEKRRTALHE